jgi:formamidopyrimidine-DNA glycosylase
VTGCTVRGVARRGKYLLIRLSHALTLVVHLRMTGDFELVPHTAPVHPHTRVVLQFGRRDLRFIDQRRFGHMDLVPSGAERELVGHLGVEPLGASFTVKRWESLLEGRRGSIKSVLLRQDLIAGIGNIYADEILWEARVHPAKPVHRLRPKDVTRLARIIRRVLGRAVASLSRYGRPVGRLLEARGEPDAPCPRCGRPITAARIAGRTTYFCPACQR